MALRFTVIESTSSSLWDFGWFDHTQFKVHGPAEERQNCQDVLREFLQDPISQRSFCTSPDPWGDPIGRHGPFLTGKLGANWFEPLSPAEFERRVQAALDDPEFDEPPSREQRLIVDAWMNAVKTRGDDTFGLDAPAQSDARVDWAFVWIVFHEFICLDRNREELIVAVIGYD